MDADAHIHALRLGAHRPVARSLRRTTLALGALLVVAAGSFAGADAPTGVTTGPRAIGAMAADGRAVSARSVPLSGSRPVAVVGAVRAIGAAAAPARYEVPANDAAGTGPATQPGTQSAVGRDAVTWALIGDDATHRTRERDAGITTKVFELAWSSYEPSKGVFSSAYVAAKRKQAAELRAAGFSLILALGVQYAPSWSMRLPNAYYVNQYGAKYDDRSAGSGRANFVWNDALRRLQARYVARVFADFGADWAAVRIGGGRFGELGYPVARYGTRTNTYWAFDANAARTNPVPGWKPGMPSPNGQARKFATWYLGRLAGYIAWQARTVRAFYPGRLMVLLPSFGIRPGQLDAAIRADLSGATSPEKNGEVARGYDFARQASALSEIGGIVLTTTWLDCPHGSDASSSMSQWRPVHYLAYLGRRHGMALYGENTGGGSAAEMAFTAAQAKAFGLLGLAWFDERALFGGTSATISDLARIIAGD